MNRRELFKGLAAALVVANLPLPIEQLLTLPDSEAIAYLKRLKLELLDKLVNPPMIMHEDGRIEHMTELTNSWNLCIQHADKCIKELSA